MKLLTSLLTTCILLPAACTAAKPPAEAQPPIADFVVPATAPGISVTASEASAPNPPVENVPLLTTEAVESGEVALDTVSAAALELFLQDLNRRKDYDYSQHNDQPGPDAAYLWDWVQKVTGELQHRGYTSDDAGNLSRPDGIAIPMR